MMSSEISDGMKSEPSASTPHWLQQPCRIFKLHEILSATENFNESFVIGSGGFGKVYKGKVIMGTSHVVAAIKRLDLMSDQGAAEFWAEVEMLSKLRHSHLVSLIGYCNCEREMILVYEYVQNGNLEDHLHKPLRTRLSWVDRLKICIGAARGLDYLHTGTGIEFGVIHRDVKSSNILLHESWAAKISDFGLSKIGPTNQPRTYVNTLVKGTFGYLDPNYFATGQLTRKSDVYAFGVVLFEMLCQKRPVDRSLEFGLAAWAQDSIKEGNLKNIVDYGIRGEISPKCLKGFAKIAIRCLNNHPKHRPTMTEVIFSLESILTLQLQTPGKSIFTKMVNVFPFNSAAENPGKVTFASVPPSPKSQAEILQSANLKPFSFNVLKAATRNFRPDSVLGEGGFGSVYKGWIDEQSLAAAKPGTGTVIAVKRLNHEGIQGHQEWLAEINYLGQLYHQNLVKLIGYCLEDDHRLLVYEFMPRGSLENHLFRRSSYFQPLSWNLRIKVALGAAKGLAYLHSPEAKVIYRDFKSSNILIDSNYNAKLSDFGLAKDGPADGKSHVSTRVMVGTHGYAAPEYMAPEYTATGHLTAQSDIYSFGVVVLEILTGRRCIDKTRPSGEQILVVFAKPFLASKRKILQITDPHIEGQYSSAAATRAALLAMKCLMKEPKHRPSADELVKALEQIQELQKASESTRNETNRKVNENKAVSYPRPVASPSGGG